VADEPNFFERIAGGVRDMGRERVGLVPRISDEVVVEVRGQPGSSKRDLYLLALTAANGVVRRFAPIAATVGVAFAELGIEYDAADHWVRCTMKYNFSTLEAVTANGAGFFDSLAVYRGPQCNVVGGRFNFRNEDKATVPLEGIPLSSSSPGLPGLPFRGNVILTGCATTIEPTPITSLAKPSPPSDVILGSTSILSPNPKPPGDNRSRGAVIAAPEEISASGRGEYADTTVPVSSPSSDQSRNCCEKITALIPLVFAALSAPATNSQMQFPNPVQGPRGR